MLAESPRFVDSSSETSTPRNLLSGWNCCGPKNHPHITLPVLDPSCYATKLAHKGAEFHHSQYLATQPLLKSSNLGDLTNEELSELFNPDMLSGFNNRFNSLKKSLVNNVSETFDLDENLLAADLPENSPEFPGAQNEETCSNIHALFDQLSSDEAGSKHVCNIFGSCFNSANKEASVQADLPNLSSSGMGSLMDPPEFSDMGSLHEANNRPGLFSKCLGTLNSKQLDKFSSIVSQASLAPSDVGCFNTCSKKMKKYVDVDRFASLASNGSMGLRNLYKSLSQNNFVASTQSFLESLPSTLLQETNQYSKYFSFQEEPSCFNLNRFNNCFRIMPNHLSSFRNSSILNTGRLTNDFSSATSRKMFQTNKKTKPRNAGPNTFRLHAVEIHQYVPFPNLPSSRFVSEGNRSDHLSNKYFENCFFNPNTTGLAAPMIPNLLSGSKAVPEVYSLTNKVNRLSTQDLSMCVFPTDPDDDLPALRVVE